MFRVHTPVVRSIGCWVAAYGFLHRVFGWVVVNWWQLVSRCCWNRARPWCASEFVSFLVGLRTYQHSGTTKLRVLVWYKLLRIQSVDSLHILIYFNIISPSTTYFYNCSLSLWFSHQNQYALLFSTILTTCSAPLTSLVEVFHGLTQSLENNSRIVP